MARKWETFSCVIHLYTNSEIFCGYIFLFCDILQRNLASLLYRAAVKDFVCLASMKI